MELVLHFADQERAHSIVALARRAGPSLFGGSLGYADIKGAHRSAKPRGFRYRAELYPLRGVSKNAEYHLTEAGQELGPSIEALGFWGARWMRSRLTSEDYDPSLLMWDIRRNIDVQRLPGGQRTVIEINLHGAEPALRRWWLVVEVDAGEVDLCMKDHYRQALSVFSQTELRWVYTFNHGKAQKAGSGQLHLRRRNPWLRKNPIEGDS